MEKSNDFKLKKKSFEEEDVDSIVNEEYSNRINTSSNGSSSSNEDENSTNNVSSQEDELQDETNIEIIIEVFIPFILAGIGMVTAGFVLDHIQQWEVFINIPEFFILVPALLGLKGNQQMTLASRLSTLSNLGDLDNRNKPVFIIVANLALVQCQGIVIGFIASCFATLMSIISTKNLHKIHPGYEEFSETALLCSASVLTASITSFFFSFIIILVILLSRKMDINPDNVATPIAAAIGDLVTLAILAWISEALYTDLLNGHRHLPLYILALHLPLLPVTIIFAQVDKQSAYLLTNGWTPVLSAMIISSLGGLILHNSILSLKGLVIFLPVINGVGGNLVAVQASRISTFLHTVTTFRVLPNSDPIICASPFSVIFSQTTNAKTARILLAMVIPGQMLFILLIIIFKKESMSLSYMFWIVYLSATFIQVLILLYVAHILIYWMWSVAIDPDNAAIPYMTALGDFLGTTLLLIVFKLLYLLGDKSSF